MPMSFVEECAQHGHSYGQPRFHSQSAVITQTDGATSATRSIEGSSREHLAAYRHVGQSGPPKEEAGRANAAMVNGLEPRR